jgi:peptide/nickel transport system ATP-binding protein
VLATSILSVKGLTVGFGSAAPVVEDVSFDLRPGDVLGLVGESGSGKTTVALSLLGHRAWNSRVTGQVLLQGQDVLKTPKDQLRRLRGRHIAYVPQNPTTALNPARRVGSLLAEFLRVHGLGTDPAEVHSASVDSLRSFGFPAPETILGRYPHQLSGGQQQRVALAIATICRPSVLVLDEPTTGLDLATQKTALDLLARLRDERQIAMVYVTHDLSVLGEIATHLGVLYAGRLVETGEVQAVFANPLHPYTRGLIAARPRLTEAWAGQTGLRGLLRREELPAGCPFSPRCDLAVEACWTTPQALQAAALDRRVACWRWSLPLPRQHAAKPNLRPEGGSAPALEVSHVHVSYRTASSLSLWRTPAVAAVADASLAVRPGEILAVVGESGSGKSTLAKAIVGLIPASAGNLRLDGEALGFSVASRSPGQRRKLQLVFQNPDASLNPRRRIGRILAEALLSFERLSRVEIEHRVRRVLSEVRLPDSYLNRFPDQLSGGERQRVAIARSLIVDPEVLICDEVLSALDVSVQAGILDLLRRLCRERNLAILFISHDMAVVRAIAERIVVLHRGAIVTTTTAAGLLTPPLHPYLHELLAAMPGESVVGAPGDYGLAAGLLIPRQEITT